MTRLIDLDVSQLEPPEPLQQILTACQTLAPDQLLRVRHRRDPLPLYPLLDELGLSYLRYPHAHAPAPAITLLIGHDASLLQEALLHDAH